MSQRKTWMQPHLLVEFAVAFVADNYDIPPVRGLVVDTTALARAPVEMELDRFAADTADATGLLDFESNEAFPVIVPLSLLDT